MKVLNPALSLLAVLLVSGLLVAAESKPSTGKHDNVDRNHLALQGYDPVAYFELSKPAKGDAKFTAVHLGHVYHFANAKHQAAFKSDPEKYVPQYGGWCATAMAEGDKVSIDPSNYKITNGRLFLFYKGFLGDAKPKWDKDEASLTSKADQAWMKLNAK